MPQQYNAQLVDELATDFPKRIEPNYAIGQALSTFLTAPRLRGQWGVSTDEAWNLYDHSGQGRTLSPNSVTSWQSGISPYLSFNLASPSYYFRATEAGLEITGSMTIWAWVYPHADIAGANNAGIIGKYNSAVGERSYLLWKTNTDQYAFYISSDGTASNNATSSTDAAIGYETNRWRFLVGRYIVSSWVSLFVGNPYTGILTEYTNATAYASLKNTVAPFRIGQWSNSNYWDGAMAYPGVSAYPLTTQMIFAMFHASRPLFMWT